MSFDEYTDSLGQAVLNIVVTVGPQCFMVDTVYLQCKGPNDGVEHKEVASKVNASLSDAGITPKQVKVFVCDEGSVMVAAYKHRLSELYIGAKLHVCAAHKLHGTGNTLTQSGFEDLDLLFSSHAVVHAKKQSARRRRWRAYFLIHVPTTSASVERSFSLVGNMDTKYRHGLPNNTRRLTTMLMFNRDVEGRFKVA